MELTAAYDDVNKKLAGSLQQYDITVKQLRQMEAEFKGLRTTNEQSVKVSNVPTTLIFFPQTIQNSHGLNKYRLGWSSGVSTQQQSTVC